MTHSQGPMRVPLADFLSVLDEKSESCYLVTFLGFLGPPFWIARISGVTVLCVIFLALFT